MKTLVVYYSYSGHTRAFAEKMAAAESADIAEIKDAKRPGALKAFSVGCLAAIRGKAWPITALVVDWTPYDRVVLLSPIWAGNVPPAVNALLACLPEGKSVCVKLMSGSGKSGCQARIEAAIQARGCTAQSVEDIKAS